MAAELALSDIHAGYGRTRVLFGVSLTARSGQLSTVIGPNGSGKSTAMRCTAGALPVNSGSILLNGEDITRTGIAERVRYGISFVPQERTLFATMSVRDNLALGFWARRRTRQVDQAIDAAVDTFPQLSDWMKRPAGSLSGGQQRVVELSRALMNDPKVLVLDEPTAGVAPAHVAEILGHLRHVVDERQVAVLLVEQNVAEALDVSDYVFGLINGRNDVEGEAASIGADLDSLVRRWLVGVHI